MWQKGLSPFLIGLSLWPRFNFKWNFSKHSIELMISWSNFDFRYYHFGLQFKSGTFQKRMHDSLEILHWINISSTSAFLGSLRYSWTCILLQLYHWNLLIWSRFLYHFNSVTIAFLWINYKSISSCKYWSALYFITKLVA